MCANIKTLKIQKFYLISMLKFSWIFTKKAVKFMIGNEFILYFIFYNYLLIKFSINASIILRLNIMFQKSFYRKILLHYILFDFLNIYFIGKTQKKMKLVSLVKVWLIGYFIIFFNTVKFFIQKKDNFYYWNNHTINRIVFICWFLGRLIWYN